MRLSSEERRDPTGSGEGRTGSPECQGHGPGSVWSRSTSGLTSLRVLGSADEDRHLSIIGEIGKDVSAFTLGTKTSYFLCAALLTLEGLVRKIFLYSPTQTGRKHPCTFEMKLGSTDFSLFGFPLSLCKSCT